MFLGIEIGGTKLQLGVGMGDGTPLVGLERTRVDADRGAENLRQQIERVGKSIVVAHGVRAVGIGFGGPVDVRSGQVVKSFQVPGWDDFPLLDWCRETFRLPAAMANDADTAGLAEGRFGAGRGQRVVFYITVGSGIGGGLLVDGDLFTGGSGIASEIGHLRPGVDAESPDETVESVASGWGITRSLRARLAEIASRFAAGPEDTLQGSPPFTAASPANHVECVDAHDSADLLRRCDGRLERLSTEVIAEAAGQGNELAREALRRALQTLGWAIAQMVSLLAPNIIVIGGGVSLMGEQMFFAPLRREVARYVYRPLQSSYQIVPAALGEEVVVQGALALARSAVK